MTPLLNEAGYRQTLEKLAGMQDRLANLRARTDVHPSLRRAAERSYLDMIGQYRREIKLFEAYQAHRGCKAGAPPAERGVPAKRELLTERGYESTKQKLAGMEERLAALVAREDLSLPLRTAVERSYRDMIRQYRRDLKLYEAYHRPDGRTAAAPTPER